MRFFRTLAAHWRRNHPVGSALASGILLALCGIALSAREAVGIRAQLGLREGRRAVAVLSGGWAGRSAPMAQSYARALQKAGLPTILIGPEEAANPEVLSARYVSMLVLPQAQTFPGAALPALDRYLRAGGHLIALGAPAFDRLVQRVGPEWLDGEQLTERLRNFPAKRRLLDFAAMTQNDWARSTNDSKSPSAWEIVQTDDPALGKALHVTIENLTGWDTLTSPRLLSTPPPGETYLTFRAKGGPETTALAIEAREKDGSRWIATVPMTPRWQRYTVHESEFRLWDPEGRSGRGGPDDHLSLTRAETITVGLAFTHTRVSGGKHEYWFAQVGSTSGPRWARYTPLTLDTLSPTYKYYPVRGATATDGSAGRALVGEAALPLPKRLLSTHPRASGTGFKKQRKWRWIPLVQVMGKQGIAGTLATLLCHREDGYGRGCWASFTAAEDEWYARQEVQRYVVKLARRMLDGPLLVEGGAEYFGYFPDETVRLGAAAIRVGKTDCAVRFTITAEERGAPLFEKTVPLSGDRVVHGQTDVRSTSLHAPGAERTAEIVWQIPPEDLKRFHVTVSLLQKSRVVDQLRHEVTVRYHNPQPAFMTTADGQFMLRGKPWYPHGVNYMPSSGIAIEDGHYFEQWMSSESYDPAVIERDLARVQAIGFNMVSAFLYTESTFNHNLIDFLNRCQAHGLKVNLSLRPGTPLDFEWPGIGKIIEFNRLAQDDTVFAYDLAWEPAWGGYDQRKRWDGEWERWIIERYGSVESAEKDWGAPVPRAEGRITSLRDNELTAASPIPRIAAAYRRFLDDFLSRKHLEARQKVRSVDPNHLLSFRMSIAGDPTVNPVAMPYDFTGVARSMDFMSPEGYGRIGEWEQVKPGWFTAAYSRLVAPGKPVMWAEFGYTIWNPATAGPSERMLDFADAFDRRFYPSGVIAFTERYYRAFYDMALKSGASGTVCWWYPGGFRYGENSDYGIINPDGTWRGLTHIIAEYAPRFTKRVALPTPNAWITVDRDAHPDGLYGLYAAHREAFWRLIEEGRFPGLRTEATGKTSADVPLLAVGNTPCNGSNPPKYLNAEFESLEVEDARGEWVSVPYEGGTVTVKAGAPIRLRAVLGNNGVAAWLAQSSMIGKGAVFLSARSASAETLIPLPEEVSPLGTSGVVAGELPPVREETTVTLECIVRSRCRFGEKRRLVLKVADRAGTAGGR